MTWLSLGTALNRITALPRVRRSFHDVLLEQNPRAPSQRRSLSHADIP